MKGEARGARWLRVSLPGEGAGRLEEVRAHLAAVGAFETSLAREAAREVLTARLPPDEPRDLEDRVECLLHALDPRGEAALETARAGGAWEPGWRGVYEGARVPPFRIRPPWTPVEPGLLDIAIDPRGAFGSGGHGTTEASLRALAAACGGAAGAAILDVGAGSGVLSVAAARLGLLPSALEAEPAAREACRRTAALNGVAVRVLEVAIEEVRERFPLVVANLSAHLCRTHARGLRGALAPGGILIASGFGPGNAAGVLLALGLGPGEVHLSSDGAWAAVAVRAP